MAIKYPFMKFWGEDFYRDTSRLTYEEQGVYLRLLWCMWLRGGSLDDSDRENAVMLGMTIRQWRKFKEKLTPFLEFYGPRKTRKISQNRLQREYNKCVEDSARQSLKGKAAAKARIERNQILGSIHGSTTGLNNGMHHGNSRQAAESPAEINQFRNKNITTTFTTAEGLAERLETPRLKRMSA